MKKRILVSLALALSLVAVLAVPAMADSVSEQASVTVNEFISFSVTDPGDDGINFGAVADGAVDSPELAQNGTTGAVTLTVGAETNVNCNVELKGGGDFSGSGGTIPLGNAKWDGDSDVTGATGMLTTDALVGTSTAGTAYSQGVWHWLSVPDGQGAGAYATTFTYSATKS